MVQQATPVAIVYILVVNRQDAFLGSFMAAQKQTVNFK
jgi:hypothetical protein